MVCWTHRRDQRIWCDSLVNLLDGFLIMVDCSIPQIAGLTVQNILFDPSLERLLIREAHPDFLHGFSLQKRKNRKHIFRLFVRKMCFLPMFDEKISFGTFGRTNPAVFPLTSGSPRRRRPRRRWRRPSGCCPCRGSPSFPRARAQRMSRRTVRRNACGPWYRSCRRRQGRRPMLSGAGSARCRRRRRRRNTSCPAQMHSFL